MPLTLKNLDRQALVEEELHDLRQRFELLGKALGRVVFSRLIFSGQRAIARRITKLVNGRFARTKSSWGSCASKIRSSRS